ncbi:MAG: hypothetical protein HYX51_11255 [Chloroflexi bacterium]|nr:hypothetical protein [Chloroflexota bacterium]
MGGREAGGGGSPPTPDSRLPTPASASTTLTNLPALLTSFVGREREMETVRRVQASTRLFTLAGAGGCGKTRLAIRMAQDLLWAYPDGVWLVELATLSEAALVPRTVAAALGLPPEADQPLLGAMIEALRPRRLLVVLDNCEHLLPACAGLVERLLRACPGVEVLATSREPLGIDGETVWRVPPLGVRGWGLGVGVGLPPGPLAQTQASDHGPGAVGDDQEASLSTTPNPQPPAPADAEQLFVERARQRQSEFALTAANAGAVAEICRRLDGIPLAIELAAAWVTVLSVDQIAMRLDDRFGLLTGGSRTALPRHRTLRAAMDWSYALLFEPEQALFGALAVFSGGFDIEGVEAVAGMGSWESGAGGEPPPPPWQAGVNLRWERGDRLDVGSGIGGRGPGLLPLAPDSRLPTSVLPVLASLVEKSLVIAMQEGVLHGITCWRRYVSMRGRSSRRAARPKGCTSGTCGGVWRWRRRRMDAGAGRGRPAGWCGWSGSTTICGRRCDGRWSMGAVTRRCVWRYRWRGSGRCAAI